VPDRVTVDSVRTFDPGDEPAISALIDAALRHDRPPGITLQDLQHGVDRMAGEPSETLVATEDGAIVGFCMPRMDELMIHPDHRRRGHGRRIVEAWVERYRAAGKPELVLHGPDTPAAAGFIAALGFERRASLYLFELAAHVAVPPPAFPPDVTVRTYRETDLASYIEVARTSFADHPTPMSFTEAIIRRSHALPDFDPEGILLVFPAGGAGSEPSTPIAWAKAEHEIVEGTGERRGFVSFVGVVPDWRGRGLGRELLRWAIAFDRAAGAGTIELNVEASNDRALELYRATGFTQQVEWPKYGLPTRK
jgi:mycothiol synthase